MKVLAGGPTPTGNDLVSVGRDVRSERVMRDSQIIHQLLVVGALSSFTLAAGCGGDSSRSSDSVSSSGSGGTMASGGTLNSSNGGSSTAVGIGTTSSGDDGANVGATASGGSSGGESSNASSGSTSSSGGTAGVAAAGGSTQGATGSGTQGGTSGAAGMSATGGKTGDDGAGGSNGAGGSDGAGGTGGSESTGAVGALGATCDSPGALSCAGNHQKLTLVCGGDGEWEVNQTCGSTEFCDSAKGSTAGVCVESSVECAGRAPDEPFCFEEDLHDCDPDGIRPTLVEDCVIECSERGAEAICINELEPCPAPELQAFNCDRECGTLYATCGSGVGPQWVPGDVGDAMIFRAGGYDEAWECAKNEAFHSYALHVSPQNGPRFIRGRVAAPWRLWLGFCEDGSAAPEQCFVQEVDAGRSLYVGTNDPNATAATVVFEVVPQGTTCDE